MKSAATNPPRRILIRGVNWLGDAVMTTPALLRLRERFPDAHIAILTPEKLRDLWLHHPATSEVISFATGENVFAVTKKLRADKFDLALVLPNSPRSALEVYLGGIPQRIGYARPWRNFFLTQSIPTRPGHAAMHKRSAAEIRKLAAAEFGQHKSSERAPVVVAGKAHQIHEYLHLVAALSANPEPLPPQLFVTADEIEATKKKFGLAGVERPVFGLNPGAEFGPAKRWPVRHFIAAAKEIQKRTGCLWLIFGGKGDVQIATEIESAIPDPQYGRIKTGGETTRPDPQSAISLAGRTSLRELMSLLKLCRVLLTNDSGPMHVAAALGTPVVVPFGSTSPELTGPVLPGDPRHHLLRAKVPCAPCFLRECPIDLRCMNRINVEWVVEAVLEATR